jgi:thiamine biosynthesis lipoprotein
MHWKRSKQTPSHNSSEIFTFAFEAIGTKWSIDIPHGIGLDSEQIMRDIRTRVQAFEDEYSRFKEDSLVYTMYKKPGTYDLAPDAYPMLHLSEELYKLTGGKFTPIIGNVLEDAGYDKNYSLKKKDLRDVPAFDSVVKYSKEKITVKDNVLLDFGACGKGYLVDIVAEILTRHKVISYCIDASGDILVKSDVPLRVGLENPNDPQQIIGVVDLANKSICASSGSRRKWHGLHHIVDPFTKTSPTNVIATWVIAETAIVADALATCLFLVEPQQLATFSFEYLLLRPDFTIVRSANFPAELYYN